MATIRNQFHELDNWHNKISMPLIVIKELLADESLAQLPQEEFNRRIKKIKSYIDKIEQSIIGADETVMAIKSFVYDKLGNDTEIPPQEKNR